MDLDLINLKRKVTRYKEVLANAKSYRKIWKDSLKDHIIRQLEEMIKVSEATGKKLMFSKERC